MEKLLKTIFPLWLLLAGCVWAETPADIFKRGNALYAEGKFSEAATTYEDAQKGGLHHWALYFNLGNAHFKTGQLGRAVADYQRAFRLNSSQRDVIFNLRLASEKAGDPAIPSSALPALLWRLFFSFSINTLTGLVSLLFFGLLFYAIRPPRFGSASRDVLPYLGGAFVVMGLWFAGRVYALEKPVGIVIQAPSAEVRSGPNISYPASFTVPEGRQVLILKEQEPIEGWFEIGVPSEGLKGWVPDSAISTL